MSSAASTRRNAVAATRAKATWNHRPKAIWGGRAGSTGAALPRRRSPA